MVNQSQNAAQHGQLVNALPQSDTFFRSLSNGCPVGIFATDTDGHCTYINPRCQSLYGFSSEESIDNSWTQFVHVDDRESVLREWLTHTRNGSEFSRWCRFQTPQGTTQWVYLRSAPLLDDDNNLTGYINTVEDITQYKPAENHSERLTAQIQEQANVLNAILCASVDNIYVFDRTGRYQYVSQGGANVMGYQPEELSGKTWRDINLPTDLMEGVDAQREAVMATGEPIKAETKYLGVDGMHYYEYIMTPWRTPDETIEGVITISRDITQRKRAEESLRLSEERFRVTLKSVPLVLAHMDRELRYTWVANTPPEFPPEALIGRTDIDIFPPEVAESYVHLKLGVLESGVGIRQEIWVDFGGQNHAYDLTLEPLCDETGAIVGLTEVALDISDRKVAEEALRLSAFRLNLALIASSMGDWSWNAATDLVTFSKRAAAIFGIPPGPYMTWAQMRDLLHEDDREQARLAVEQAIREHSDYDIEYRVIPPNGEQRWVSAKGRAQYDPLGQVLGMIGVVQDVSDRKLAEEALRLSQERYRSLVESLPQLVYMAGTDGITEYCNQSWMNYTGLTLEQTQSSGWQQALHPDDLPLVIERWTQTLETGNPYSIEFRIRRFDGVYRWHLNRIVPIKAEEGKIDGWLGTATDIDDQKRTEQQERFLARASQTFAAARLNLQTVLDTITRLVSEFTGDVCALSLVSEDGQWLDPVSCYHVDPEVRDFVSELLKNYPRRPDEGIGGRVMQTGEPLLMPVALQQDLRTAIKPEYQLYLERFTVYSMLLVPLKVQGQAIGVLSLTRNHPGEPHNSNDQSLFQDLADRAAMAIANARLYQQAQQARHQAIQTADRTARLQAVTAALSESLTPTQVAEVIVEQSLAVLNATSAIVAILSENGAELEIVHYVGYQEDIPEQWRRFPITTPVPLAEAVRMRKPIWEESTQTRSTRYPYVAEMYATYNHAAWISLPLMVEGQAVGGISLNFAEFSPLSDDDRAFMLALAQQSAQAIGRARLYEAEQRARASAETANRIKDEFLAVLSHELRSPLNPILGWTRLLQTRKFDEQATNRALEIIERNAKLQTQLIEDLLDVSRILRGKMVLNVSPVNLATTVEAALETMRLAAESKGIQIQTSFAPNVGFISGDSARLQQVVWNLLSNAIKFTPKGGRVEVRVEQDASYAQIIVSDTGKGINPEFLPYVFEYFCQEDGKTTRKFGGLGLGLAIVRHLVELHGGTVQASSLGEGKGAIFTVNLPLTGSVKEPAFESESLVTTFNLSQLRILVVDDEADMRELLVAILSEYGAQVRVAASAAQALTLLDQFKPEVLLSDIGMPDVDGYMLMRQVRRLLPQQGGLIPAIALTAYAGELNQQQALEAGFQRHVAKPVEPYELVKTIAVLVGRSA